MTHFEDIIVNTIKEGETIFSYKNFIKLSIREILEKIERMEIFKNINNDLYRQYTFLISRKYLFELNDRKTSIYYFKKYIHSLNLKIGYL
jgi:hypothetical protein